MKIGYHTLGCKVNQYETQSITQMFENRGYETVDFDEIADIYIINTCTVTNVADKKSRQMLSKAKKHNPNAVVVAVGCYAQVADEKLKENTGIDLIIGNTKKNEVADLVESYLKAHDRLSTVEDMSHMTEYEEMWLSKMEDKKRAHIKVQDGCNQFCSYCIIPYTRGRVRSREKDNVIREVEEMVKNGYKEVVLTGIHLASYGLEFEGYGLIHLLEELEQVQGLSRIRLGSLEPTLVTEEFVERLKGVGKLCPHFHLSLQSGCDSVLKRMNRKYTTQDYRQAVSRLRGLYGNPAITTDIIVGFPGETEDEFMTTAAFAREIGFADIHVFKYSIRQGTKAAEMKDQVRETVKSARSKILSEVRDNLYSAYQNAFLGHRVDVLIEEEITLDGITYEMGHSPNYLKILIEKGTSPEQVWLEKAAGEYIVGKSN